MSAVESQAMGASPDVAGSLGRQARAASRSLARSDTATRNRALARIAARIEADCDRILAANALDLEAGRARGLDAALLDRLALTRARIAQMAGGVRELVALADPVGRIDAMARRPSGIEVGRMRVPLGVILMIYESRPNVTVDAAALCLKSGTAVILRGGSEALHSNLALADCVRGGLEDAGLPADAAQIVSNTDRALVGALLTQSQWIDVVIPRGGRGLIERVSSESRIPVIRHLDGNCHVYIDDQADEEKALRIAFNAKTHRYGVCNAMETLLVAEGIADRVLPRFVAMMVEAGVEVRGCPRTRALCGPSSVVAASEADWDTEYLAPVLAVRVVADLDAAVDHITRHGSAHTDAIVTENWTRARRFVTEVDSSSVIVNASTRFADGYEYGLGAEIGISTDRLHARGPVGLEALTTEKWIVFGDGQIRD